MKTFVKRKAVLSVLLGFLLALCAWTGIYSFRDKATFSGSAETLEETVPAVTFDEENTNLGYTITYEVLDGQNVRLKKLTNNRGTTITSIAVPAKVTYEGTSYTISEIGDYAFGSDSGEDSSVNVNSVDLSATSIVTIGANAFKNNALTTIKFPSTLITLGEGAFNGSGLTMVSIPNGVKHIPAYAFRGAPITKLELNNVESIGKCAFAETKILNLEKSNVLRTIEDGAFMNSALTTVRTGSALEFVGEQAFHNANLKYFDIGFRKPQKPWGASVFNEDKTVFLLKNDSISGWAGCLGLSATGDWVEEEASATWKFSSITILDVPNADANIENVATAGTLITDSHGLKYKFTKSGSKYYATVASFDMESWDEGYIDLVIPEKVIYDTVEYSVAKIDIDNALQNNVIHSVYIGAGIVEVTEKSFIAGSVKDIYLKSSSIRIRRTIPTITGGFQMEVEWYKTLDEAWTSKRVVVNHGANVTASHIYTNYELTDATDAQGIRYYLDETYGYAVVGDVATGDDVNANTSKYAGSSAYSGTEGHAVISDYVSHGNQYYKVVGIGRYAFYNCEALKGIKLGAFVGSGLDIDAAKIETTDKNGETIYLEGVFDASGNLVEAGISDCAFRNCQNLTSFKVDQRNEVYMVTGSLLLEKGINGQTRQDIPVKIVKAGKNVTAYTSTHTYFANISTVENYAFANCAQLTSFEFNNIELIGEHAFENTMLQSVDFSAGDESNLISVSVGDYAFANCYAVTNVTIGAGDKLGRFVFWNDYSIQGFASNSSKYLVDQGVLYEAFDSYAVLLQYPAGKEGVTSFTVDSCQDLPVTEIEGYAFGYSALTDIVVSDNVLFIGKAAFSDCSKLLNVKIGKNVVAIGAEIRTMEGEDTDAYYTPSYKADPLNFDRAAVEIYEREVFDGCNVLSGVKVDKENQYYLSDNNDILYNKDKTTLLMYAPGITRVSYTVPNTVTKIGIEAFENNVHLQRLILNENVQEVGAKAFNGCTKLYSIYFRSLEAPMIGEQVFNSTGALVRDGLTIYCIPEPGVWLAARAELWREYTGLVEQYVAIQEVPDQAQPTAQVYLIYVMDSDGNYLPDMKVTFGYQGMYEGSEAVEKSLYVNNEGYAVLTLPVDLSRLYEGGCVSLTIEDEKGIYYTYSTDLYHLDLDLGFSYITLRSIPTVEGISCDGQDISTGNVSINTVSKIETEDGNETLENVEIWVSAQWDSVATFKHLALYMVVNKNGVWSEKRVSTEEYTDYPEDHFFYFEIEPRQVVQGAGIIEYYYEARLTVLLDGETKTVAERLNVDLFYEPLTDLVLNYLDIEREATFSTPDSVPLLGGIEFDFVLLKGHSPFRFEFDKDRLYVGINFSDKVWYLTKTAAEQEKYEETRKKGFFERMQYAISETMKELKDPFGEHKEARFSLVVTGGVEIQKKSLNAAPQLMRGTIKGYIKYEFEYKAPTVWVWWIPIQFEVELTAEGELSFSINVDELQQGSSFWESNEMELDISIEVELRGGIGCNIVSVGIYGSASLDFILTLTKDMGGIDGGITLDIGFYAKLDLGLVKWKKKFSWTGGGIQVLPFKCTFWTAAPHEEPVAEWSYHDGRQSRKFRSFNEAVTYALSATETDFAPFEGEYSNYGGAESQIVWYNNTYYRFYIDNAWKNNNIQNKGGLALNEYNYLKLVYQKMNADGTWGAPYLVNQDVNNETDFDVVADVNGIHILYRRLNTTVTAENSANYVSMLDVYKTTFANGAFDTPVKVSTTSSYKSDLEISVIDGTVYAAWVENADNNVFGMSNDNVYNETEGKYIVQTTTANSVWAVVFNAGQVSKTLTYEGLPTIADIDFVKTNRASLFIVTDKDCDVSTVADRELKKMNVSAGVNALQDQSFVDAEGKAITSIMAILYEKDTIYVQGDGVLYACAYVDNKLTASVCASNIYSSFEFIYDASGNLYGLGFVVSESEGVSNLYVAPYIDGQFVNALKLTNLTNGMVENFTTYAIESGIQVIYLQSSVVDVVEGSEDIVSTYSTSINKLEKTSDLVLEGVDVNVNQIQVGNPFEVEISIWNDSLQTLNDIRVILQNANLEEVFATELTDLNLLPGERRIITVEVSGISEDSFTASYTLTVSAKDEAYIEGENDQRDLTLGYADLEVTAKYLEIAEVKYFLVMVQNAGTMPVDGFTLLVENGIILADAATHEYLYELTGEYALAPGEYKYFTIELNKVYFTDEYITVTVKTDTDEYNLNNNLISYSMKKNEAVNFGASYTLSYYVDGKLLESGDYKVGSTIEMPTMPEKEGYTFSGWSYELTQMPAYPISIYGTYVKNRYVVNYYIDGGNEASATDEYEYGATLVERTPAYREGYTFSGWYTDSELTQRFVATTMPANDLSLYGEYTINTYTVSYYLDGQAYYVDGKPYVQTYTYGANVTLPTVEKEGYDFKGWSKANGFQMPAYNLYVYGSTQIKTYQVRYVVTTGTTSEEVYTMTATHGSTLNLYQYFAPEGYAFDGWYLEVECTNKVAASSNRKVTENLTLYGKNTAKTYVVNYYVNGENVHTQEVVFGEEIPAYVYECDGFEFVGWQNLPGTMPAYNLNVYGDANVVLYEVSYVIDGQENAELSNQYPAGANVILRAAPNKEGYTFSGWYTDANLTTQWSAMQMPTENIQVYGRYIVNTYAVHYYVDSIHKYTQEYAYGANVTAYAYTAPTGYSFLGFDGVPETMPAYDLHIYGKTSIGTFTLTYYVDGQAVKTEQLQYGTAIEAYVYQAPVGKVVSAWVGLPATMPASDVSVMAMTSNRSFNLNYYVDGELVKTDVYEYNATVTEYAYEAAKGRAFLGFVDVPEKMPGKDVNVYGSTTGVLYKLNYYVDDTLMYTDLYLYDAVISLRDNYNQYGYTFSGWSNVSRRMPDHDIDVRGTLTKNSHNVYYYVDEELLYTDAYLYGDTVIVRGAEQREGYTFTAWTGAPSVMQDEDVIVRASFVKNTYEVVYYVDGTFYKTESVAYGDAVDLSGFETDAYSVTGWTKDGVAVTDLTVGASNIRLDAVLEEKDKSFAQKPALVASVSAVGGGGLACGVGFLTQFIRKKRRLGRLNSDD